jgi:cytochrome c biogenesis protein CcdA
VIEEANMATSESMTTEPTAQNETPTAAQLVREAFDEARELARLEIALARDEAYRQLRAFEASAIAFGVAAGASILGIGVLLVALVLATDSPLLAVILGIVLLAAAGAAAAIAMSKLPTRPLEDTQRRVKELRERVV